MKKECFISLKNICCNGLISLYKLNEEEEEKNDLTVKITQALFCYSKGNKEHNLLIDEISCKLGKDYFI